MSLVVPNDSDVLMLKYIVNNLAQDGGSPPSGGQRLLRLFTNNLTPGKSTTIANINEATATGYSPITLTGTSWTVTSSAGTNSAVYNQQTFTFTTGSSVYGYYITTIAGDLLWLERFSVAPFVLPSGGGEIAITPKLNLN
jgi:hypothetical protein